MRHEPRMRRECSDISMNAEARRRGMFGDDEPPAIGHQIGLRQIEADEQDVGGQMRVEQDLRDGRGIGDRIDEDRMTGRRIASTGAKGWDVRLPNALATARFGGHDRAVVYAKRSGGGDLAAQVRLTATSVSDPSKTATATCTAFGF